MCIRLRDQVRFIGGRRCLIFLEELGRLDEVWGEGWIGVRGRGLV